MSTSPIVLDDLRRHIGRRSCEMVIETVTSLRHFWHTTSCVPLLIFGDNLGGTEIDELDDTVVVQKNV